MNVKLILAVVAGTLLSASLSAVAQANCIAHQPANAQIAAPASLNLSWECVTGGPVQLTGGASYYAVTFRVTNEGMRRTQSLQLQANLVDPAGNVVLTVPINESAQLGQGNADGAVYLFPEPPNLKADHTEVFLLAVQYADGGMWKTTQPPPVGPLLAVNGNATSSNQQQASNDSFAQKAAADAALAVAQSDADIANIQASSEQTAVQNDQVLVAQGAIPQGQLDVDELSSQSAMAAQLSAQSSLNTAQINDQDATVAWSAAPGFQGPQGLQRLAMHYSILTMLGFY
jgi:hypothetical protein